MFDPENPAAGEMRINDRVFSFANVDVMVGGEMLQSSSHIAREVKLEKFGPGPWIDEPDRVEWRHEGLPCLIRRGPLGALCGYVAVPPEHPWHGAHYDDVPASAHGGLTFADRCHGEICHVPQPGEPDDVWWFGFDCGHYQDLIPEFCKRIADGAYYAPILTEGVSYRDVAYVRAETLELAEQVVSAPAWIEYLERIDRARSPRQRRQAYMFAMLGNRFRARRRPHPDAVERREQRREQKWRELARMRAEMLAQVEALANGGEDGTG